MRSESSEAASPPATYVVIMLNLCGVVGTKGGRGVGFENLFLAIRYGTHMGVDLLDQKFE